MFFNDRQRHLTQRTVLLQAQAGVSRDALQQALGPVSRPLYWADRIAAGWRWLLGNPEWVAGAAAVLVVWRPRRLLRFGLRLWGGWRLWLRLRRWHDAVAPGLWPQLRQMLARRSTRKAPS